MLILKISSSNRIDGSIGLKSFHVNTLNNLISLIENAMTMSSVAKNKRIQIQGGEQGKRNYYT